MIQKDKIIHAGCFLENYPQGCNIIDGTGLTASIGFFDMHVHLREPGFTHKEDIYTGTMAAAAGGFTSVLAMPNTDPVIDTEKDIAKLIGIAAKKAVVNVLFAGAVTAGQKGEMLTDFSLLKTAGAAALSDDGHPVAKASLMRDALIKAKACGIPLISHCEELSLAKGAVNMGKTAEKLNVSGIPVSAESIMAARDCALSLEYQVPVHIAHVSSKMSVDIIRLFKGLGAPVTAETAPHYFSLTEDAVLYKGANAKMNPPLRTEIDRTAIIEALADDTIDVIATDHAPHLDDEKNCGLSHAPNGIIGLETALSLAVTYLVLPGYLSMEKVIGKMTAAPFSVLGLERHQIKAGAPADICLFDPSMQYTVRAEKFHSKSKNTPFDGMTLTGKATHTFCSGKLVYEDNTAVHLQ